MMPTRNGFGAGDCSGDAGSFHPRFRRQKADRAAILTRGDKFMLPTRRPEDFLVKSRCRASGALGERI